MMMVMSINITDLPLKVAVLQVIPLLVEMCRSKGSNNVITLCVLQRLCSAQWDRCARCVNSVTFFLQ